MPDQVPHLERERVHPTTRAEWRDWLARNAAKSTGAWLVSYKPTTGKPRVGYDEAVEEGLCFGWVDSKQVTLDDERTMLWFTPRKRGSGWSRSNKERVERLEREGLMTEAGRAAINAAKADGSWSLLDDVEALVVPDDLVKALDEHPPARQQWDGFPPGARRQMLAWVASAKRPETRARRIEAIAEKAQQGQRVLS